MKFLRTFIHSALCIQAVLANTEKLIFTAPGKLQVPTEHPTLQDLKLHTLSPHQWSVRTHLQAEFPLDSPRGKASWVLLQNLQEGQRYEVRVCWAATQPTSFHMQEFEIPIVFQTPELVTSLANFTDTAIQEALKEYPESDISTFAGQARERDSSMLLLQIHSAADYYTMDKAMMDHAPPVFVDIILDPYLFKVFPQSLLPTAGYITMLAIGSWFLSLFISSQLHGISQTDDHQEKEIPSQAKERKGQKMTSQTDEWNGKKTLARNDVQRKKKKS